MSTVETHLKQTCVKPVSGVLLFALSWLFLPCSLPAAEAKAAEPPAANRVIRAAVIGQGDGKGAADLLTVALSKQADTVVLERAAIEKILSEQSMAGGSLSDPNGVKIGQLLKAEIIVLLQNEPGTDKKPNLRCKVLSVHPGVVLESLSVPLPIKDMAGLVKILDEDIARLRPKLLAKRHILLTVPKFKSMVRKEESADQETALHGLLIERLSREAAFFVAERQNTSVLLPEQTAASESMPATVMVEGTIEESQDAKTPLQLHLYLRQKAGAARDFSMSGKWEDLPTVVDQTARRLVQELKAGESSLARWEPEKEAAYFAERAKWMLEAMCYDDAIAAVDVACFLGKGTVDLERIRVDAEAKYFPEVMIWGSSPLDHYHWEAVTFDHKTVCERLTKCRDLLQHLGQVWQKDPNELRTPVSSKYGYALMLMWSNSGDISRDNSRSERMRRVLVNAYRLLDTCHFVWQDDLRKDPEANELWKRTLRQYRSVLQLGMPQDPREALFARVREAHIWCDSTEDIIALINKAWADSLSQPELSVKRLDGLKAIIEFVSNTIPSADPRESKDSRASWDTPRRIDLRKAVLAGVKRYEASAATGMTRQYCKIIAGKMKDFDPLDQPEVDLPPKAPDPELVPKPTPEQLAAYLEDFIFLSKIGGADWALSRYAPYFWEHRTEGARLPIDYLPVPEKEKWLLWDCDPGTLRNFIEHGGYYRGYAQHVAHSNNDFCYSTYAVLTNSIAVGAASKDGQVRKDPAACIAFLIGKHPELNKTAPPAIQQSPDVSQQKKSPPPPLNPDQYNIRLAAANVWSLNDMSWTKRTIKTRSTDFKPVESNAFWTFYTAQYGNQWNIQKTTTLFVRVSVPDLKTETFECPWIVGGNDIVPSPRLTPGVAITPGWKERVGILNAGRWMFVSYVGGIVRMDLVSHEFKQDTSFEPEPNEGALVVGGKILQPTVLAESKEDASMGRLDINGILQFDAATMEKKMLVSGLRVPPQTLLDYPAHLFHLLHAHTNGDVVISDWHSFKVQKDYESINSESSIFVYNIRSNSWRKVKDNERCCSVTDEENDWRSAYALKSTVEPEKILPDLAPDATGWYYWDYQAKAHTIVIELRGGKKITVPINVPGVAGSVVSPQGILPGVAGGIVSPQGVFLSAANGISFIPMEKIRKYIKLFGGTQESNYYRVANAASNAPYMVIDVSSGPSAARYPVSYVSVGKGREWPDEYKTTKIVLRRIPNGTFTMGSPPDEPGRKTDEIQHQVTLSQGFFTGVFAVTQKQWERVMGNWPSFYSNETCRDSRPVENVSHADIRGAKLGAN